MSGAWAQQLPVVPNWTAQPPDRQIKLSLPKPSQAPAALIPVAQFGYTEPSTIYLGQRISLISMDFLDEDRLLFSFRVPGLIHRSPDGTGEERHMRAVVLHVPDGRVEAEALWLLHDRAPFVWTLGNGEFLLRNGQELERGDRSLELKDYLRYPGPLVWVEVDPEEHFLVSGSVEPKQPADSDKQLALRILDRQTNKVRLETHLTKAVHVPINSHGYIELVRVSGLNWQLDLRGFDGSRQRITQIESTCGPTVDFVADNLILLTECDTIGDRRLEALTTQGRKLWQKLLPDNNVWPLMRSAQDGRRVVRETLALEHPISATNPLTAEDVKQQRVEVLDTASGRLALTAIAAPVYDAGGNVALSPSGRRAAVLAGGSIEIFELNEPDPLP